MRASMRGRSSGRERLGQREVVVEAVLDGRPDGVLGPGDQVAHGLGHDVRRRVAEDVQPVGLGGTTRRSTWRVGRDRRGPGRRAAPSTRAQTASSRDEIADRGPGLDLAYVPVGQRDLRHQLCSASRSVRSSTTIRPACGSHPITSVSIRARATAGIVRTIHARSRGSRCTRRTPPGRPARVERRNSVVNASDSHDRIHRSRGPEDAPKRLDADDELGRRRPRRSR